MKDIIALVTYKVGGPYSQQRLMRKTLQWSLSLSETGSRKSTNVFLFLVPHATPREQHVVFNCSHLRGGLLLLLNDAHGAMRMLMQHKHQKYVCAFIWAICRGPDMRTGVSS